MNEQRFALSEYSTVYRYSVIDNIQKGTLKANEIIILLNKMSDEIDKQEATIQSLKEEIKKLNGELYNCEKFRYQVFQGLNELNSD